MTDNNNSQYARVLSKQSLLCLSLSSSIGIGVFLIVSHVSKECGNLSWLAMLCAGIFSIMTAYSYAELSSIFNSNSTEYEYIKYASKSNKLATLASVIIIVSELLILATIAIGLGHYCKDFIPLNENIIAVFAVLIFNYLNYRGIKTSADFSKYALSVKIGVIVLLIFIGIYKIKTPGVLIEKNKNVSNLIKASTLGLFSFIGFTGSISLTEEAKNPSDIPEVIILTTLITTFLYIALTIALLVGLGSTALSNSSSPLADISFIYFGNYGYIIFKALIIVALLDSLLITSIIESRYIHSIAENYIKDFQTLDIHKEYKTPYISIIIVVVITCAFILLFKSLNKTAMYADFITICMFIIVNFIAIWLRFSDEDIKRTYKMPLNYGRLPLISVGGLLIGLFVIINLCKKQN